MRNQLYQLSETDIAFPNPEYALESPDGLLAIGGDLSLPRLSNAYKSGIFPWFSEDEPIMWWSPSERGIFELNDFHISKSLRKHLKKHPVRVTINNAFEEVIEACLDQRLDTDGNCSKLAMWALVNWLKRHNAHFIDCQLENPYLMTLGAQVIPRSTFLTKLKAAHNYTVNPIMWEPQELDAIYE